MFHEGVRQVAIPGTAPLPGLEAFIVDYTAGLRQTAHRHDHASITLVLRGAVEESCAQHSQHATALTAIAKGNGTRHTNAYGPNGCRTLQINFGRDFDFTRSGLSALESARYSGGPLVTALLRLVACAGGTTSLSEASFALCDALAALPTTSAVESFIPKWLSRTKEAIDCADPSESLSLAALGQIAAVHPVHLTRRFKRHYGSSIRDYIQKRRFHAAAQAVADEAVPLGEIAHRFGYSDQAHFCRAFQVFTGVPARAYRRLVLGLNTGS